MGGNVENMEDRRKFIFSMADFKCLFEFITNFAGNYFFFFKNGFVSSSEKLLFDEHSMIKFEPKPL